MAKQARKHPILGRVTWDAQLNSWDAEVELPPGNPVHLSIVAEAEWADADPAELLAAGAEYLRWARQAEPQIRQRVADDLHECYNSAWADEDPEEGTPPMDRAEFLAAIRPDGVSLYHDGSASWFYACGELFGGHGIWLMLGPDRGFKGKASLVG
ncbi:DUF2262 domain-containing protein [bacterium]|nr:DUF2262 domain-containing protein [Rhodospirillales bacterium]MBN9517761.1 DUF2262 domain-containing protein [bacterium]